jgi:hypothetical protein
MPDGSYARRTIDKGDDVGLSEAIVCADLDADGDRCARRGNAQRRLWPAVRTQPL